MDIAYRDIIKREALKNINRVLNDLMQEAVVADLEITGLLHDGKFKPHK